MSDTKTPTKEELELGIQQDLEKLDEIEKKEVEPSTPALSPSAPIPSASGSPAVPSASPSTPVPSASPSPEVPPAKEEKKGLGNWKERHEESTREAQRLYRNNAQVQTAILEATNLPEPTAEELKGAFLNWEDMTETEKNLSKDSFINKRFREVVGKAAEETKNVQDWNDRVDKYIDDPQILIDNPELEGKEELFKNFVEKDKKLVGTDFKILIGAFLHEQSKTAKPKNKGQMFETGSGGPNDKPKPKNDKISLADAEVLKERDYKKYKELLMAEKIEDE